MTLDPTQPSDLIKFRYLPQAIRQNFQVIYDALGPTVKPPDPFPPGTKMWFYQDTAPPGWTIVATTTDTLLGIKSQDGQGIFSTGGNITGTWQLPDCTLTEGQMPRHSHRITYVVGTDSGYVADGVRLKISPGNNPYFQFNGGTETTGDDQPHNHGNSWRPVTAVGIIAEKD